MMGWAISRKEKQNLRDNAERFKKETGWDAAIKYNTKERDEGNIDNVNNALGMGGRTTELTEHGKWKWTWLKSIEIRDQWKNMGSFMKQGWKI